VNPNKIILRSVLHFKARKS